MANWPSIVERPDIKQMLVKAFRKKNTYLHSNAKLYDAKYWGLVRLCLLVTNAFSLTMISKSLQHYVSALQPLLEKWDRINSFEPLFSQVWHVTNPALTTKHREIWLGVRYCHLLDTVMNTQNKSRSSHKIEKQLFRHVIAYYYYIVILFGAHCLFVFYFYFF